MLFICYDIGVECLYTQTLIFILILNEILHSGFVFNLENVISIQFDHVFESVFMKLDSIIERGSFKEYGLQIEAD